MKNKSNRVTLLFIILLFLASCAPRVALKGPRYNYQGMSKTAVKVHKKVEKFLDFVWQTNTPFRMSRAVRIDSVVVNKPQGTLDVYLNKPFSYVPFREENVHETYALLKKFLGRSYRKYRVTIFSLNEPIEQLIPNYFRPDSTQYDFSRLPKLPAKRPAPVVRNVSRGWQPARGLFNRNIGLWPSHGWYYNQGKERWEWQRPRLFQTVEDLLPASFVLPYLIPMLENAGANVFVPRERDIQKHEVVVDNDSPEGRWKQGNYQENSTSPNFAWTTGDSAGFAIGHPPYTGHENPFRQGTFRQIRSDTSATASVTWTPDVPETGWYSVSIAYHHGAENVSDAHYTVYHAGGKTEFRVNQQIGGETWIYLGRFKFFAGIHPDSGKIVLTNESREAGKLVTADAVRLGGGMGSIARGGNVSGRPRFEEGARYFMQYAGMPDSLVYNLNHDKNDYKDDYQGRAEFVNYLHGAPFGPNANRQVPGLGIPMDLSLAFHTDAGFGHGDTTVGTLSIYSILDADSAVVFPDSMSRVANRDFADILQTQIVQDIRQKWDPAWNRRPLHEAQYSEAYRPNVPAALLELLSHQNYLDATFELDPRFRFDVARAIYKAMLRFLATQYRQKYVVQPLPVSHFAAVFSGKREVTLSWKPELDPLEPSAKPEEFVVYTRIDSGGFDNGHLVKTATYSLPHLIPGKIYSFRVTALNQGGESFPSEILSVCWQDSSRPPVLIVNGFDRVSGPARVATPIFSGFVNQVDMGVPDRFDLNFTGNQYDFSPRSPYRNNDGPGFGASHADFETRILPGNTFDFPYVHGRSIRAAGFSFVSVSRKAVEDGQVDLGNFKIVDVILGEQKATRWQKTVTDSLVGEPFACFPPKFRKTLQAFAASGGNLFVSGAYVGTDLFANKKSNAPEVQFGQNVLGIRWDAGHAARSGKIVSADTSFWSPVETLGFNQAFNPRIYQVEAPDALNPAQGGQTILRYAENEFGAGIAFAGDHKAVVLGFPFETILSPDQRNRLMKSVLKFLLEKKP